MTHVQFSNNPVWMGLWIVPTPGLELVNIVITRPANIIMEKLYSTNIYQACVWAKLCGVSEYW